MAVGFHDLRMASDHGLKWTNRLVGVEDARPNSNLWAEGRFVAVGLGAMVL